MNSSSSPDPKGRSAFRRAHRRHAGRTAAGAGVSASKRQIFALVLLLAIVGLLAFRLTRELGEAGLRGTANGGIPSRTRWIGRALEDDELGLVPVEIEPPEPFEEDPLPLARAAALDKTPDFSEAGIVYLFHKILALGEAFAAEEPVARNETPAALFDRLYASPDLYRGELVEIWGTLVSAEPGELPLQLRGLEFPNPSGRDRAFQSHVFGRDGRFYVVATLERRDELRHRDAVRLRGYFCQLYTNDVEVDGRVRSATIPLLVGKDFELLTVPRSDTAELGWWLPVAIVLPLVAFVVFQIVRTRRDRAYRTRLEEGRRRVRPPRAERLPEDAHDH